MQPEERGMTLSEISLDSPKKYLDEYRENSGNIKSSQGMPEKLKTTRGDFRNLRKPNEH